MEETVFFLLYYSTMLQIHYSISLKHGFNQSLGGFNSVSSVLQKVTLFASGSAAEEESDPFFISLFF